MSTRIVQVTLILARLPLRVRIRHAGGAYAGSENIFVCCRLSDGSVGWGEGVPRERLQGLTAQQLWDYFWAEFPPGQLAEPCRGWNDVLALCESLRFPTHQRHLRPGWENPLRCALELAILDAYGRSWGQSVSKAIEAYQRCAAIFSPRNAVQYSGTILRADPLTEMALALLFRAAGFSHGKLKVGTEPTPTDELRRIKRLRRLLGRRMDLRVDANGAWTRDQALAVLGELSSLRISCVEDPLHPGELHALPELRQLTSVPILLDEPIATEGDLKEAVARQWCDLINVRISKCGGLLRSAALAAHAAACGIGFQLGCHPGESGVLSAAGRHFATAFGQCRYAEGSFDRFLFRRLITREDITFSRGGWAPALHGPGLGVTVLRSRLAPYILRQRTLTLW